VKSFAVDEVALRDGRRRNEMLVRGLLCLLVKHDARDWMKDIRIRDSEEELEVHHIFPEKYLENLKVEDPDLVANLTVLLGSTNSALRSDPPGDVAKRKDVSSVRIESHRVPIAPYAANDWPGFLDARVAQLKTMMGEAVG
jgi:hypothetical protein